MHRQGSMAKDEYHPGAPNLQSQHSKSDIESLKSGKYSHRGKSKRQRRDSINQLA